MVVLSECCKNIIALLSLMRHLKTADFMTNIIQLLVQDKYF